MFEISWTIDGSSIVLGFEGSNVAFIAIGAILLLAVIAGTRLWLKSNDINLKLEQGRAKLREFSSTLDVTALNQLDEFFLRAEYFRDTWKEYKETLLQSGQKVYSTVQAERFFNDDSLIESSLLIPFYTAVPGLLTSLGLMGTFVSIYIALMQLPISGGQVTDITPFIRTLSGKFLASIAGIMAAFIFVLWEKRLIGGMKHRCRGFQIELNALVEAKPQEILLDELNTNVFELVQGLFGEKQQKQHNLLRTLLVEVLDETSKKPIDNLAKTITELLQVTKGAFERRDDVLSNLVVQIAHEFRQALTEAASDDIKRLAEAMASASALSSELRTSVDTSLTHLQGLVQAQKDQLDNLLTYQAEQSDLVRKTQLEQFEELTGTQNKRMDELLKQFSSNLDHQFNQINTTCQMVTKNIDEVASAQRTQSSDLAAQFRNQIQAHSDVLQEQFKQLSEAQSKMTADSTQRINETIQNAISALSDESKKSASTMAEMSDKVLKLSADFVDNASGDLQTVLQNAGEQSLKSNASIDLLRKTIDNFDAILSETKKSNQLIAEMSELLLRANQAVTSSEIAMRKSNTETRESVKVFQEQIAAYQSVLQAQNLLWVQQKESLVTLGSSIDSVTSALKNSNRGGALTTSSNQEDGSTN